MHKKLILLVVVLLIGLTGGYLLGQGDRTELTNPEKTELLDLIFAADEAGKVYQFKQGLYDSRLNELKSTHNANGCQLERSMHWGGCVQVGKKGK